MLHLREHDPEPYREALLDACLTLDVYDTQANGTLARFLADLITATDDVEWFIARIEQNLSGLDLDDVWRALEILTELAVDRHSRAERVVRDWLAAATDVDAFTMGSDALIEFDGLVGVVTIARRIAELTPPDDDIGFSEPALMEAESRYGAEAVERALSDAASSSAAVERFCKALRAWRAGREARWPPRPRPTPKFDRLKEVVAGSAPREFYSPTLWWRWGRQAPENEIRWLADQVATMADAPDDRLRTVLSVFNQRMFPGDYRVLLRLEESQYKLVSIFAFNALDDVRHADVRTLGLQWLNDPNRERRRRAIQMLLTNYDERDRGLILSQLLSEPDEWVLHGQSIDVRASLEQDHPAKLFDALPILFERGPCAMCRHSTVQKLIEHGDFSDTMARECLWDADLDIRKLAQEFLAARA